MYEKEIDEIYLRLKEGLPEFWDGKKCILHMKESSCRQWRQMEWIGFYFQFMCEKILGKDNFMKVPGPKYGNVEFDGFKVIPWDFKAHSTERNTFDMGKIPTNGYFETSMAIKQYGSVGFIIIQGYSDYDDKDMSFKKWHDELKGGISAYEKERIKRSAPSRKRKVNFEPKELIFVLIDEKSIDTCGLFQANFRNSDGSPRNPKVMLDLKKNLALKIIKRKF